MQHLISITLSIALALATLAPAVHAETATPGGPRAEDKATIKADREKLKQDREQLKQDREQLRKDRQAGNQEAVQQDLAKLKQDRELLKKDRMKLREDREKLQADRRALYRKGASSVKPAPKPQS